jgi:SM-20-related protein
MASGAAQIKRRRAKSREWASYMNAAPTIAEDGEPAHAALARAGCCLCDSYIPLALQLALARECKDLVCGDASLPAAIGRRDARRIDRTVRGDHTRWLEPGASPPQDDVLARFESLRDELNRTLYLNLFEVEAHFACYPSGAAYARHRDAFRASGTNSPAAGHERVISAVLYLNDDWQPDDGGELRLYLSNGECRDIAPLGGRLVLFLSADFEHEVLPPRRPRYSVAAWFHRR